MRQHGLQAYRTLLTSVVALSAFCISALAQQSSFDPPPTRPNSKSVSLIAQDFSDCTNTTVNNDPNRTRGGEIWVTQNDDGTTSVQVGMTVNPDTTYHLFLKCVRLLGDIKTDGDGIGLATFSFQTSEVGSTFAFDMYPEGAPAGNKFQSMTVTFP